MYKTVLKNIVVPALIFVNSFVPLEGYSQKRVYNNQDNAKFSCAGGIPGIEPENPKEYPWIIIEDGPGSTCDLEGMIKTRRPCDPYEPCDPGPCDPLDPRPKPGGCIEYVRTPATPDKIPGDDDEWFPGSTGPYNPIPRPKISNRPAHPEEITPSDQPRGIGRRPMNDFPYCMVLFGGANDYLMR